MAEPERTHPADPESHSPRHALPTAGNARRLIHAAAAVADLPAWCTADGVFMGGEWLEAVALQESSGRTHVRRYEGQLDHIPDGDTPDEDDGDFEDDASWGPFQILGSTARGLLGLSPMARLNWRRLLCSWLGGLDFALRLFAELLPACGGRVDVALARWNGGAKGNDLGGALRNQAYVDGVRAWAVRVRAERVLEAIS